MNAPRETPDLGDSRDNGLYLLGTRDFGAAARAAVAMGLRVARIDLAACHDKPDLLKALAAALEFPDSFGHNWDALADCLCDLDWLPAPGHVLLFESHDDYARRRADDLRMLIGILADACRTLAGEDRRLFALFTPLSEAGA